jgi:type I restriction enzyme S subunit
MTDFSPLGDITELITKGTTPSTLGGGFMSSGINFIKVESISDGGVILKEKLAYIDEATHEKLARSILRKDDILFSIAGAIGRTTRVAESVLPANTNQALAIIRVDQSKACVDYVHQCVQGDAFIKTCSDKSVKSAQANVSLGSMAKARLYLPPLAEQRKIAEILRTWDEAIETADAELKAKQERKRGIMQRLLSPGRQIKRKAGNSFNESVRRFELNNGWSWMFIHEVAKLSFSSVDKKSVKGEKSVRLCNYMDVFYNRRIREGMPFMKSTASDSDIKKFTLNEGNVVLTKDSETPEEIAFAAVIDEQIDNLVCGYHLAVLRPDKAKVTGEYLMSAINFHPNHHQFVRLANGATRFGLGIDSLNNAVIPIPPLEEQRKIAEILQNADAGIEVINNRIEALRTQKRGLMQKLLTGEVRVAA